MGSVQRNASGKNISRKNFFIPVRRRTCSGI